jgi:hypothetical protein
MCKRLKKVLVESYVGAIALGWVFAEGVSRFTNIFTQPISNWLARSEFRGIPQNSASSSGILLRDAAPGLVGAIVILFVWYLLMRWLYFKPFEKESAETMAKAE